MEKEIFEQIRKILSASDINIELLELRENKTFFSVSYLSTTVCAIKISKKLKYLSFHIKYKYLFNESFNITQIESDQLHFRVNINETLDVLNIKKQLTEILHLISIPITFDICSRYIQCSDARTCIHPDKLHSMECSYRKKLEDGIIFYGKNRNI